MESVVKEVLGELQREYNKPLKVLKIVEEDNTAYIITNRRTKADEGLKIALPILLKEIANEWNTHRVGVTYEGVIYLVALDDNEEDIGLIYHDYVIPLEIEEKLRNTDEDVSRFIFFGVSSEEIRTAFIIPKDLWEGGENEEA